MVGTTDTVALQSARMKPKEDPFRAIKDVNGSLEVALVTKSCGRVCSAATDVAEV